MRIFAPLIAVLLGLAGLAPSTATPAQAAEVAVAPEADLEAIATDLADQTMRVFVEGIRKRDFRELREIGSARFKAAYTPEAINTAFRSFTATIVTGDPLADQWPAFLDPPAMSDGQLRMQGFYELPDGLLLFDLAFVSEAGDWQLDGIDVRSQPIEAPATSAAQQE
jgi:hypothetical protein